MEITRSFINGLLVLTPRVFTDERGYFIESFNQQKFDEAVGKKVVFVQDNESVSKKHVLRGLHYQNPPNTQGKLVRVVNGSVYDVAVDLRKDSPTYGKWHGEFLSAENKKQFWIPEGFAHGFVSLEDNTVFLYKCTNFYAPQSEGTIIWNDPSLAIDWKVESPIISEKDAEGKILANIESLF